MLEVTWFSNKEALGPSSALLVLFIICDVSRFVSVISLLFANIDSDVVVADCLMFSVLFILNGSVFIFYKSNLIMAKIGRAHV